MILSQGTIYSTELGLKARLEQLTLKLQIFNLDVHLTANPSLLLF